MTANATAEMDSGSGRHPASPGLTLALGHASARRLESRHGALTLAMAGIIRGNAFDTLFVAATDIAYRGGSVALWVALSLLMTGILTVRMIHRERQGPGRIGFESVGIIAGYLAGALALLLTP